MFGFLGGQHVFQCILSVTKYSGGKPRVGALMLGLSYILFTRSLDLVPRVTEGQQTSVLVSAHPLNYVDLQQLFFAPFSLLSIKCGLLCWMSHPTPV